MLHTALRILIIVIGIVSFSLISAQLRDLCIQQQLQSFTYKVWRVIYIKSQRS